MKKTLPLLFLALIGIGAAIAAGLYATGQKNLADERLAKIDSLKTQVSDLNSENGELTGRVDSLNAQLAQKGLPPRATATATEQAMIDTLRAELEEARAKIAAMSTPKENAGNDLAVTPKEDGAEPRRERREDRPERGSADFVKMMQERMERMKQEDPEGYQEQLDRRTTMRNEMREGLDDRIAFFNEMDLTGLSPEMQQSHNQLMLKLADLRQRMAQIEANPESFEGFGGMREAMGEINDLMQAERDVLMTDLANDLGYKGEDAGKFIDTIDYIREMTTAPRPSFGRGGPGGGRGGPGGGGRGR